MAIKIALKDVWFSYTDNTQPVLRNININIEEREVFVIAGQCGCGKSTLAKLMVGLISPTHGNVLINDIDINNITNNELLKLRLGIGFLFQNSALMSNMKIIDNIALPLRYHLDSGKEKIDAIIDEIITRSGLTSYKDKLPAELSIGQRKRAAVARALALNPQIMIYDEPTAGLDPINSLGIYDIIKDRFDEFKTTSVIITHDMLFAKAIATRIAIMYRGKIIFIGKIQELNECNDPFVKEFMNSFTKQSM